MKIQAVIERLERGDVVRMELVDGVRQWWFEAPLEACDDDTMTAAMQKVKVVEFGDSLFGLRMNSQTWQAAKGSC